MFLEDTFASETSINSPVVMVKGSVDLDQRKEGEKLDLRASTEKEESPTFQVTCCVQVNLCL